MKTILSIFALLLMFGCAAQSGFKERSYRIHQFCSSYSVEEAYSIIGRNSRRCHDSELQQNLAIDGYVSSDRLFAQIAIERDKFGSLANNFVQVIEINQRDELCPSEIKIYQANDNWVWTVASEAVGRWMEGSDRCQL